MPRSPLTLAASVAAALPKASVVSVRPLTEHGAARFDTVAASLDDGARVVARVAADDDAATELAAGVRALAALTPGVRALLPFQAPTVLGESTIGDARVVVVDHLAGYRIDAAQVPAGPGIASLLGAAIAAIHALPASVPRAAGLAIRTPNQLRDDIVRLLDRVDGTRRAPGDLVARWRRAVADDELWRFESTVGLDGVSIDSFVFRDGVPAEGTVGGGDPEIVAVLDWHGLSVGDPAIDLRWTSSAPLAADAAFEAYAEASEHAPDAGLRARARLHAELEFARWLVHGHDSGRTDVVDDAAALLASLASGVAGDDLRPPATLDVDDALALLERTPAAPDLSTIDTSMQTDAYDPRTFAFEDLPPADTHDASRGPAQAADEPFDPNATAPLDLGPAPLPGAADDHDDVHRDAERAALQRWARSDSE